MDTGIPASLRDRPAVWGQQKEIILDASTKALMIGMIFVSRKAQVTSVTANLSEILSSKSG